MSIRIIAEGVKDTSHAVFEANEILKEKPDLVFMELPSTPFQEIFNAYHQGKLSIKQLKRELFKAIQKEEREVDHELHKKLLAGEIEKEELDTIETEGREIHVMQAAKKVGARLIAMDMPLDHLESIIEDEFAVEHIENTRHVLNTGRLPFIVWELSDLFHWPYYALERFMHHHAIKTTNPFVHNVNVCRVCKLGTWYDRFIDHVIMPVFQHLPLSRELKNDLKVAYVIRHIDYYREKYMARMIARTYHQSRNMLGRKPKAIAIVHLWNAVELERLIRNVV